MTQLRDNPALAELPVTHTGEQSYRPTIWGLKPSQLHDRFWAARGVQVVRQGEPSEIVADAELYLLTDPRTLTLFQIRDVIDTLSWLEPDILFIRLFETLEHGYKEVVVSDAQQRFVRLQRIYGGSDSQLARVAVTPDREIARIWQSSTDPRSGWRRLRRMAPRRFRSVMSIRAKVYDRSLDQEVVQFIRDLVQVWKRPDVTAPRAKKAGGQAWIDADSQQDDSVKFVGPVWVGAGRKLEPQTNVVGPVALWDVPESRPKVEDIHWLEIEHVEAMMNRPVPVKERSQLYRASKRIFDIFFAGTVLLMVLPIFPLVMLAISIEDGRPWIFGHKRETLRGREFNCWKFRSMRKDSEQIKARLMALNRSDGPQFFIDPENDPRLTRVGKLIRKLNVDELPQLWNVILGDMSMVGPRPSPFKENQFCPAWREARLSVRPGITGLWQVKRSRLPGLDFQEWIKFDLEYVENSSWWLDIKIIFQTIKVVLQGVLS